MCIRAKGNDPLASASSWQRSPTELSTCVNLFGCPYFSRGGRIRSNQIRRRCSDHLLTATSVVGRHYQCLRPAVFSLHSPTCLYCSTGVPGCQDRSPEVTRTSDRGVAARSLTSWLPRQKCAAGNDPTLGPNAHSLGCPRWWPSSTGLEPHALHFAT